jgi:cytochrome c-type biogenesis protein CcmE
MKFKILIPIILITLSVLTIAFFSSQENSYILLDTDVFVDNYQRYEKNNLRIRGNVKIGSVIYKGKETRFKIKLNNKEIPVIFYGTLPDAFKEGVKVRVDGIYRNNVLYSNHIEAKCASKYEANI